MNARRLKSVQPSRIDLTLQTRREESEDRDDLFAELAADELGWL
jgi:hypothetical protein